MVLLDDMSPEDDDSATDVRQAQPFLGLVHWLFGGIRLRTSDPFLVICPSSRILGDKAPIILFDRQVSVPCSPGEFGSNPLIRAEGIGDKPQAALVLERQEGEIDPRAEGDNDDDDDEEDDEGEGDDDDVGGDDDEEGEEEDEGVGGVAALMSDDEDDMDDDGMMDG
jgi:hypothetical protein